MVLDSADLFDMEPDWGEQPMQRFAHSYSFFKSYGLSALESFQSVTQMPLDLPFLIFTKAKIQKLIDFFNAAWGRLENFWFPTWQRDFKVTAGFDSADTVLIIQNMEYLDYWLNGTTNSGHYIALLPMASDTIVCRKIVAATDTTITLDLAVGFDCPQSKVDYLLASFLLYGRFDTDKLVLKYITDNIVRTYLSFIDLPENYPVSYPI